MKCGCPIYYTRIMPTIEHQREMRDVPGFWVAVAEANRQRLEAARREHAKECRAPWDRIMALAALASAGR